MLVYEETKSTGAKLLNYRSIKNGYSTVWPLQRINGL